MTADPHEILADLTTAPTDSDSQPTDHECVFLDRADPAYIWADEDDDRYILLEQTRSGTWLPRGRPITADTAAYEIEQTLETDTAALEVRPQTALPPGRHRRDR